MQNSDPHVLAINFSLGITSFYRILVLREFKLFSSKGLKLFGLFHDPHVDFSNSRTQMQVT